MARRSRWGGVLLAGLALGFASACNDIVPLDCDATQMVTDACPSEDTAGEATSSSDESTITTATSATTSGSDVDSGSASEPTGVADTGSSCGDGVVDADEECDDGDLVDIDECNNACRLPPCGDGIVQPGEDCDLGLANDDHGACKLDCHAAICGDGVVRWEVEACDGEDIGVYTCADFGYGGGTLLCDRACQLDASECTACPDGELCDAYQPCERICESGAECWNEAGQIGTCLPPCMTSKDCLPFDMFFAECIDSRCMIPCEQECPPGMICQPSIIYPGTVCLW